MYKSLIIFSRFEIHEWVIQTSQLNSISASIVITLTLKVFGCFFFKPRIDIFKLMSPVEKKQYSFEHMVKIIYQIYQYKS